MKAAGNGRVDAIRLLIEAGANPNATNRTGETPLMWTTHHGHVVAAKMLLEAGADPNATDLKGETALMQAAFDGHEELAELLMEAGADPNAANLHGDTAMSLAISMGHRRVAAILCEFDRTVFKPDEYTVDFDYCPIIFARINAAVAAREPTITVCHALRIGRLTVNRPLTYPNTNKAISVTITEASKCRYESKI